MVTLQLPRQRIWKFLASVEFAFWQELIESGNGGRFCEFRLSKQIVMQLMVWDVRLRFL